MSQSGKYRERGIGKYSRRHLDLLGYGERRDERCNNKGSRCGNFLKMLFTDVTSQRTVKALEKVGFWISKKGKHIGMSDGKRKITIPRSKRLNPYTLKSIIRDAGLTDKEFKDLL
jgi:predicted RNA binding protein YcfA (HicA-like mRNA interferase family)